MLTDDSSSTNLTPIVLAHQRKREKGAIRRSLLSGELTLAELMADPPVVLRNATLADILWMRRRDAARRHSSMIALGERAMRDGVNLMIPLSMASARSRAWVAANGDYMCHNQKAA